MTIMMSLTLDPDIFTWMVRSSGKMSSYSTITNFAALLAVSASLARTPPIVCPTQLT
jgi:hypothetical protein